MNIYAHTWAYLHVDSVRFYVTINNLPIVLLVLISESGLTPLFDNSRGIYTGAVNSNKPEL